MPYKILKLRFQVHTGIILQQNFRVVIKKFVLQEPPASQPLKPVQPAVQSNPPPVTNGNASNSNDPMMGMSAKEMREFLANKRKQDPKKKKDLDFAAKVNMLQKM